MTLRFQIARAQAEAVENPQIIGRFHDDPPDEIGELVVDTRLGWKIMTPGQTIAVPQEDFCPAAAAPVNGVVDPIDNTGSSLDPVEAVEAIEVE